MSAAQALTSNLYDCRDAFAATLDQVAERDNRIVIGSHVWIGSRVSVLKGSVIPDGCVVASSSVVKSIFTEKNALIAGNPAKIVRQNVSWS